MEKYYLAYGSNLNVRQMLARCPEAKPIGTTYIPNYALQFKGSKTGAYLTIKKESGAYVPAAVWKTNERDEAALDRYEGCPVFYYKTEMKLPVKMKNGKIRVLPVYVYIMHEDRKLGVPSFNYVITCLEGYRDFDLPEHYLTKAVTQSRRMRHEND